LTTVVTVAVSVVLALAGYLATYAYDLRLARRKDQLERVNEQLSDFYGPLLALVDAGRASWRGFRTLYRPGGVAYWGSDPPPTPEEAAAWRLWMMEVFHPLNERIVQVVTEHAHLLDEPEMPQPLLDACAHVAAYRPVVRSWQDGDTSQNTSGDRLPGRGVIPVRVRGVRAAQGGADDSARAFTASRSLACSRRETLAGCRQS
jgi:hypothetical protein